MTVRALFPTYLFEYNLIEAGYVDDQYLDLLKSELDKMMDRDPMGRFVSNNGGWQSNDGCESNSNFSRLNRAFNRITQQDLLKFFGLSPSDVQLPMGNCWANINPPGTWNVPHCHNGCWYSGVFYIDAEEDQGDLILISGDQKILSDFPSATRSSPNARVVPQRGKLILFPSGAMHMVEPNQSERNRYSVAFNFDTQYLVRRKIGESYVSQEEDPRGDEIFFELDPHGYPVYPNLEHFG